MPTGPRSGWRPEADATATGPDAVAPREAAGLPEMATVARATTALAEPIPAPGLVRRGLAGFFLGLIWLYRVALSPLFAGVCRFQPSCSHYAEEAIRLHGPGRGIVLAARRLLRCHPFGGSGYDAVPAPPGRTGGLAADLNATRGR